MQILNRFKIRTSSKNAPVQILHHPHQKLNNNIYNINNKTTNKYKSKMDNDIYKSHPSINPDKHTGNDKMDEIDATYDYVCQHVKDNIDYDIMVSS